MIQRVKPFLPYLYLLGLLLWGGYVTLYFLGYDSHIVVLLRANEWKVIAQGATSPFLRGLSSVIPFLSYLFERLRPFTSYAVISVLFYLAYVAYTILKRGRLYIETRLSALHIILLAVGSLWLLTTTLFYAPIPGLQPRLLIEPSKEVYDNIGEEGVTALVENFQSLSDRGCLVVDPTRTAKSGARVFTYRGWCMQKAFFKIILSQLGMLLFLVLDFLVLGRFLLWLIRVRTTDRFMAFLMSLGLGAAALTFLLWVLALFGALQMFSAWILLLLVPAIGYRHTWYWLRSAYKEKWTYQSAFHSWGILLFWLLVSYLAFNFLTVSRPFPIGWDDLGKYINAPRQMSTFGSLIPGMFAIQWEYLTSLGFVLFGYFSTFGATLAQQINWMAGLFAVLAVFACTRLLLGSRTGLLAALFYYTLPMVGHFSFADMKTENALFFYGVVGFMCVLLFIGSAVSSSHSSEGSTELRTNAFGDRKLLLIAGILFAAGFATKPTVVLPFFMGGVILTFVLLGNISGLGSIILSFAVLSRLGGLSFSAILRKVQGEAFSGADSAAFWVLATLGVLFYFLPFILAYRKKMLADSRKNFLSYCIALSIFLAGFLAFSAPWMVRNMVVNKQVSPSAALHSPNKIMPWLRYTPEELVGAPPGSRALPEELKLDPEHEMCKGTAKTEELDRYWGYGSGWKHYLELPWRVVMNKDSQGYYLVTSPFLLILPLIFLLPFFWSRRILRFLFYGTIAYVFQWIFVANGIPWYGIGMFLGFAVFTEAMVTKAPGRLSRIVAGTLVGLAIAMSIGLRLWQFDMQRNLYEYAWGKASKDVLQEMTIPDYNNIADHVMRLTEENPDRPYLYRMGTFISYFIPRNLEIVVQNDNQLGFFNCLNQEGDHKLTLKRLRVLGVHSIVFDTNTATIEKDPNGTLHQKVKRFLAFANDPEIAIRAVVNNPGNGIAYMILPEPAAPSESEESAE